jgi:kinesin family protein 4/21/27
MNDHALNGSKHTHSVESPPSSDAVQVVVRIRPLLPLEAGNEESLHVVSHHPDLLPSYSEDTQFPGLVNTSSADSQLSFQSIQVGTKESAPSFTFDHVFPSNTAQKDFYETSVAPLVQSCLEGYHATVLAYGQTGSGKTHSMLGGTKDPNQVGVIPRGLEQVFAGLEARKQMMQEVPSQQSTLVETGSPGRKVIPYEYSVKIQFIELYGEEFRDLLSPEPSGMDSRSSLSKAASMYASLNTRAGGPEYKVLTPRPKSAAATGKNTNIMLRDGKAGSDTEVLGVEKQVVHSPQQALNKLHAGMAQRVVGRTAMNANSSRSHAIFTIILQQTIRKQGVKSPPEMKTSKIHFVDLSGSESIKRSKTVGKRRKEGIDINKGLLVLGNVISALAHPKKRQGHVPYRDSKLTRLLKGSLGGNHKTLMIACVSPSESNTAESINTLRYANRAKCIQNHAKVNVDPASRVVNELRSQVAALAKELLRVQSTDLVDVNVEPEEEEEFLFSTEFLHSLVGGVNAPPLWRKKEKQTEQSHRQHHSHHRIRKQDSHQDRRNLLQSLESAPSSDSVDRLRNEMNGISEENDTQSVYSVETGTNSTSTTTDESKLGKNIISYDFALSALRNTIEAKTNKTSEANSTDSSGLGLKTVRNIDELYQYLNEDSDIVIENDEMDEEESVYSNRVSKLNDTIAENEILLRDMTDCHEKYQVSHCRHVGK